MTEMCTETEWNGDIFISVDAVQILYKDSEHVDSLAAETDASANNDDGGVLCVTQLSSI